VDFIKADAAEMRTRLAQCEGNTTPFVLIMERRRMEEETLCRGEGLTKMLSACCSSQVASGNEHRRFMPEVEGCDALPSTCSAACAPLLIEYFEGCQGIIDDMAPDERQGFQELYGKCEEGQALVAAMLGDARPAMIFHVLVTSEATAQ
jgi:hypothetical protein